MGIRIFQVDAFTATPFRGNPAAVCLLSGPASPGWMQDVAQEMNLSETAFLYEGENGFNLRWFTPMVEVDLCGHATLASAHVLWEEGFLKSQGQVRFQTRSGLLTAEKKGDRIELNFPSDPVEPTNLPSGLAKALNATPQYVGKGRFDYLVELNSEESVKKIRPDFNLLKNLPVRGVSVTGPATSRGYDFISRFFAPREGINEDPVTGSAHCSLGPFWSKRLGKKELIAYQASERGGIIHVRMGDDRVYLGGQAVTILRGELVEEEQSISKNDWQRL